MAEWQKTHLQVVNVNETAVCTENRVRTVEAVSSLNSSNIKMHQNQIFLILYHMQSITYTHVLSTIGHEVVREGWKRGLVHTNCAAVFSVNT